MTTINFNQAGQTPNDYANMYAAKNGISLNEAIESLQSEYGEPEQMQAGSIFDFGSQTTQDSSTSAEDFLGSFSEESTSENYFQKILDFFRGGNGPQNEGDPQTQINPETQEITGPINEGDPQFVEQLDNESETNVSQNPFNAQGKDPDSYAQEYADENNLTPEEAKAELKSLYGDPQKM